MKVECPECATVYSLDDDRVTPKGLRLKCSKCKSIFSLTFESADEAAGGGNGHGIEGTIKVLIAHDNDDVRDVIEEVLSTERFEILRAGDGVEALEVIKQKAPHVALIDVALSGVLGFEVCRKVKDSTECNSTKLILMASVYDTTRYKRSPVSLYGADDYVEKHHIYDKLVSKIYGVVSGPPPAGGVLNGLTPVIKVVWLGGSCTEMDQRLKRSERVIDGGDDEVKVKARTLARIIVSDILLYNSDHFINGIREGNFYSLIEDDIKDGIGYFKKRVPPSIPVGAYLKEAFEDLLSKKKKEMGLE